MNFCGALAGILLLTVSAAANGHPCALPPAVVAEPMKVESFADLQALYAQLVPAALNSQPVIVAAERTAARTAKGPWPTAALAVANATYRAQIEVLAASCPSPRNGQLDAVQLIEASYGQVLARTQLRKEPAVAARLLPEAFAANLTSRVGLLGLSLSCSRHTPALARLLERANVPCGKVPETAPAGR